LFKIEAISKLHLTRQAGKLLFLDSFFSLAHGEIETLPAASNPHPRNQQYMLTKHLLLNTMSGYSGCQKII